jgi:biotin carboxylase
VASAEAAIAFLGATGGPVVLKPIGGSGSELIFRCDNAADCARHFQALAEGLTERQNQRLYQPFAAEGPGILAEAHIAGEEYSCDFIVENERAAVIRLTRKVRFDGDPFGTAKAYVLPGAWPEAIDAARFQATLYRSARALGLERSVGMLDFFVHEGRVVLLEMAPRPGGDCLPPLLRRCCNLDMLQLMLDFACRKPLGLKVPAPHAPMVGLRLHAGQEGTLVGIDDRQLRADPRVREIQLTRRTGHCIKRPPEDYDAWLLGHVIFVPAPGRDVAAQCRELNEKLLVEVR